MTPLPMSTTTVRLPEELEARIARLAEKAGTTAHALIVEAISEKAEQLERRSDLHEEAERRFEEIIATGKAMPWNEMRKWMRGMAKGEDLPRPKARKLGD